MLTELKKSIKRPEETELIDKEKVPVSILMNKVRQKILQFLFKYPCTHLHGIARNFGYSINNTRWHLEKLKNFGYVDDYPIRNRKVFFPNNFLKDVDIVLLALLNDKKLTNQYLKIMNEPGITQKELCDLFKMKQSTIADNLNKLELNDLIYSQRDGIYRRYFPTEIIKFRVKTIRKSLKEYRRFIIQLLKKDGVEPEILRTTDKNFHVRIKSGKFRSDMIFFFNPYDKFLK
jgi:predicted transcriptional regulator